MCGHDDPMFFGCRIAGDGASEAGGKSKLAADGRAGPDPGSTLNCANSAVKTPNGKVSSSIRMFFRRFFEFFLCCAAQRRWLEAGGPDQLAFSIHGLVR
jgi:hypothetical protein